MVCSVVADILLRRSIPQKSVLVVERRPEEITIETARGMKPWVPIRSAVWVVEVYILVINLDNTTNKQYGIRIPSRQHVEYFIRSAVLCCVVGGGSIARDRLGQD